jgi:hypothetical protein
MRSKCTGNEAKPVVETLAISRLNRVPVVVCGEKPTYGYRP